MPPMASDGQQWAQCRINHEHLDRLQYIDAHGPTNMVVRLGLAVIQSPAAKLFLEQNLSGYMQSRNSALRLM